MKSTRGLPRRSDGEAPVSPKQPDSIDKLVGRNIRIQRLAKGLSQTELANQLGVTFQQVQKYEKGVNRIGCGRLFQVASVLGADVTDFFEGGPKGKPSSARTVRDVIAERQSHTLVQACYTCVNGRLRSSL